MKPKPHRRKDAVLFIRVPSFQKETVRKLVDDFLSGRIQLSSRIVTEWIMVDSHERLDK